ncbi:MAG: hypothetical protein LWY06_01890 [Firmicutes bacterium]|nr:hypothetical protein [Bacillota bacterium]
MFGIGMNLNFGMSVGGGSILDRAMGMASGGMGISSSLNLPGLSLSASAGLGFGADSSMLSQEALMGGGSNFFHPLMGGMGNGMMGSPMGGLGCGMGMVPGMMPGMGGMGCMGGMGQMGGMMKQMQMMQMMQMMQQMMQMMQSQMGQMGGGMPGMGMPGMGMPGMGMGMPGMGMPGMGGMNGMDGMGGMGGMGGGPIELQKGGSWTSPGGSTIKWEGDTVNVNEPGGGQRQLGGGGGMAFAGAMTNGNQSMAFAGVIGGVGGNQQSNGQPNNWKVWGDPHINDGAGKQQDFKTNNAMFSLQDGTKVAMCAAGPQGVVERVRIFPPNTAVNQQTLGGIDPSKTTVYQNQGNSKVASGTLDQYAGVNGMGMSPFGNQMFGMF